MISLLSEIARAELARRHANVCARLTALPYGRDRDLAAMRGNAQLYPWVAIAVRCGAEVDDLVPEIERHREYWRRDSSGRKVSDAYLRLRVADDFCPEADMIAELTRARDVAISKVLSFTPAHPETVEGSNAARAGQLSDRAQTLSFLAIHLRCPPVELVELQEAA